jgi:hypothetical protein
MVANPRMEKRPTSKFLFFILKCFLVGVKLEHKKKLAVKPTLTV